MQSKVLLNCVIEDLGVFRHIFPSVCFIPDNAVLCMACYKLLRQNTVPNGRGSKRALSEVSGEPLETEPPKKRQRQGIKVHDTLRRYFEKSDYQAFARLAFSDCPALRREMLVEVTSQLHKEVCIDL